MAEAFIVAALRTAGGRRNGKLSTWHPADMGGEVLNALVDRTGIDPRAVEDVIVGCVSQVGEQSFHIGRNVVLASGLPDSVPAVSIDRQCGSSQQAVHFAAQAVMSGTQDVVIAAGVESMSRVPMGSPVTLAEKAGVGTGPWSERIRRRYGVRQFSQFTGAQMLAEKYGFTREQLDEYALRSHQRAAAAIRSDAFNEEIVPLEIADGTLHTVDEGVRFDASIEAISSVKPLQEGSVLSAANSSQICDGASAVLVVNERGLKTHNLKPLARIHNLTVVAGDPVPSSWQRSSTRCASAASATDYRRCARAAASPTRPSSKRFERSGFGILRAEHRAALLPHGIDRFAMIGGARHRRLVGHACIHHGEHGALQVDIHQ